MVVYSSVQHTSSGSLPYILLFTLALTRVWFDAIIIDINTILYPLITVPASPDQGHDRLCRRGVGRVFLAGVRPDSPSRRRIPSCYRPGPGRGVVVELGQRGAH